MYNVGDALGFSAFGVHSLALPITPGIDADVIGKQVDPLVLAPVKFLGEISKVVELLCPLGGKIGVIALREIISACRREILGKDQDLDHNAPLTCVGLDRLHHCGKVLYRFA